MLIGIHAKSLSEKHPTGVGEYARRLLQHMLSLSEAREHRFRLYADEGLGLRVAGLVKNGLTEEKILHAPFLWTQGRLAWELACRAPDVFFTPQHVLPRTAPKNSIATIHGLEFERYPQFYARHELAYLRWVTKDAVRRALQVIAVSQATKNDLMELYGVPEQKISVVYHGAPSMPEFRMTNDELRITGRKNKPYFVYVGRIECKKNIDGIVQAFEIAKERYGLPHELLLAGGDGYGAGHIKYQIAVSKYTEDIKLLGYVSEEQKWELLRNAEAFVFPSWYEGFGLPILEAQTAGAPVITSHVSAMPEVAGKGALYADPAHPESIAEAMRNIANDFKLRQHLVEKGIENIRRFSWQTCAQETFRIVCSL